MENTLERLVDRIYQEGISRADDRAASIVSAAEAQAKEIIAKAQTDAARRVQETTELTAKKLRDTQSELQGIVARAQAQLRRDISALLSHQVLNRPLSNLLSDADFLRGLIIELITKHRTDDLTIILPKEKREEIVTKFSAQMAEKLPGLEISVGPVKNGFIVKTKESGYEIEFSEESFLEFLKPLAKEATAKLFT